MDERKYFEEKREERETKAAFVKMMRLKMQHDLEQMKLDVPFGSLYETH